MPSDLAAALVAAQAEMPPVEPNATNPHFGSKFVSLDHLIAKTRPVLNKHGLAILQKPTQVDGQPALETTLIHKNGETVTETMPLILAGPDMQKLGAALTYARRYAWAALLGIAAETDDDGNQASTGTRSTAAPAPTPPPPESEFASDAQVKNIWRLMTKAEKAGVATKDQLREQMGSSNGTEDPAELSKAQASKVITDLKELVGEE
jgi:hypothetical protein